LQSQPSQLQHPSRRSVPASHRKSLQTGPKNQRPKQPTH